MNYCRNKARRNQSQPLPPSVCRSLLAAFKLTQGLGLAIGCVLIVSCGRHIETAPAPQSAETNAPAPAAAPRPEFSKLLDKWERPDGGYVLEIKSVDASGKLEASYFNPAPINIAKALALSDSGTTKVFIELRDANYPGCTYSLAYDPQTDQLHGEYFQAAMQQTFEVVFTRMK